MKPEYKIVRIPRNAGEALEKFAASRNKLAMRVNASHYIGDAIMEKLSREKANAQAKST